MLLFFIILQKMASKQASSFQNHMAFQMINGRIPPGYRTPSPTRLRLVALAAALSSPESTQQYYVYPEGSLRAGHAPTVGLWGLVSRRKAAFQNVDSSRRTYTFTSAHSERNEAEIHCIRRPGGRDENRSFMNIPAARSKLAVSSAERFRQALKIYVRRLLHIVLKPIYFKNTSIPVRMLVSGIYHNYL